MRTELVSVAVDVTAEDAAKGEPRNCLNCAVARAVGRATGARFVAVRGSEVNINGRPYPLPDRARRFVAAYDAEELAGDRAALEPFAFALELDPKDVQGA